MPNEQTNETVSVDDVTSEFALEFAADALRMRIESGCSCNWTDRDIMDALADVVDAAVKGARDLAKSRAEDAARETVKTPAEETGR